MLKHFSLSLSPFLGSVCICFALLLGACTTTAPSSNDWERLHLKGKVKQFEEWTYSSYAAFNNQQHNAHQTNWFSEEGLLTKGLFVEGTNRRLWSHYTYQSDSVWIRRTLQVEGGAEQTQNFWLYKLNEYGQQEQLHSLLLDTSVFYTIQVEFDEQKRPATLNYSNKRNPAIVPCQIIRTYKEDLKVSKEVVYVYEEANAQCYPQPTTSTYTYNEQGAIEREKIVYFNGTERQYSYQYTYDEQNNWISRLHYEGDVVIEATKRAFSYYE